MKTETKHTPGPWGVDYSGPARLAIVDPAGTIIAFGNMQNDDGDVDEANARLIAAAPELLEALERLADIAEGDGMDFSRDIEDVRIVAVRGVFLTLAASARAAIAKARGEKGGGV